MGTWNSFAALSLTSRFSAGLQEIVTLWFQPTPLRALRPSLEGCLRNEHPKRPLLKRGADENLAPRFV